LPGPPSPVLGKHSGGSEHESARPRRTYLHRDSGSARC